MSGSGAAPHLAVPHLGVIVGLAAEAAVLRRYIPTEFPVTIELSGARIERAQAAVARLLARGVSHLLSFGYAGGLGSRYSPGTLLVPREILTVDGRRFAVDLAWHHRTIDLLDRPAPVTDPLLGADRVIDQVHEKARLNAETGAGSVDMESHVAAAAAHAQRIPFLAIRALLDAVDRPIPPAATASLRADGSIDLAVLVGSLVRQPSQIPGMIALGRDAGRAKQALLGCSRRCGPFRFGVG